MYLLVEGTVVVCAGDDAELRLNEGTVVVCAADDVEISVVKVVGSASLVPLLAQ